MKYKVFGPYLILEHLVDGGMAKIYLARAIFKEKFQFIVIKIIQPQYVSNESFIKMFNDEMTITNSLIHPGLAQVYDYGKEGQYYYAAIEFIQGANLKEFLSKLISQNKNFPIDVATHIVIQTAKALHFVHHFVDPQTGNSLNIVHRDISPHNIMISYDGYVKVIDFGIAKADMEREEKTKTGTLKGKVSYLAPEYIEGLKLDNRYDIFSLGITFWEILTGKKLFDGPNDMAIIKLIQDCQIPDPRDFRSDIPEELVSILFKSLKKERMKRFQTMDDFQRALSSFLQKEYVNFNSSDLTVFNNDIFFEEIGLWKEKVIKYANINIEEYKKLIPEEDRMKITQTISLKEKKKKIATIIQENQFKEEKKKSFFIEKKQSKPYIRNILLFSSLVIALVLFFYKSPTKSGVTSGQSFYPGSTIEIFTTNGFIKEKLPLEETLRLPAGLYNGIIYKTDGLKKYIQFEVPKNNIIEINESAVIVEN